jgi:hypothetical protein
MCSLAELLIVFSFCCRCCFDLSSAYSHNKINGIPNTKNIPIVRTGIRKTNRNIPKHNVAMPRAKSQRVVRLSTIYRNNAPFPELSSLYFASRLGLMILYFI